MGTEEKKIYPARSGGLIALLGFFVISMGLGMVNFQGEPKPITLKEYNKIVANEDTCVLVYCTASWCAACKKMKPIIDKMETYNPSKLKVLRIEEERDKEIKEEFELNTLPVMMLYKKGQQKWSWIGVMDEHKLRAKIDPHLY